MRHRLAHRKLNRDKAGRKALLRGLATQLLLKGRIVTTIERAKELRKVVEPLVSVGRTDNLFNRRTAMACLYGDEVVSKLFSVIGPANKTRPGGYTRILRMGFRAGDRARQAMVEFVEDSLRA